MRIIARQTLIRFAEAHPEARASLDHWFAVAKAASWTSTAEDQATPWNAKVLNAERVRFGVSGGRFRLIAAFDFPRGIAFVRFVGTHADDDRLDALTVSQF